jgi:hypothetical protein
LPCVSPADATRGLRSQRTLPAPLKISSNRLWVKAPHLSLPHRGECRLGSAIIPGVSLGPPKSGRKSKGVTYLEEVVTG